MKEVNYYTSNEFHDWQRKTLPRGLVIQDLDGWALLASEPDGDYKPLFLIELKRTKFKLDSWTPHPRDKRNYAALTALAEAASIPLVVIVFNEGRAIEPDDLFLIVRLTTIWPEYRGVKRFTRAATLAATFPHVFEYA